MHRALIEQRKLSLGGGKALEEGRFQRGRVFFSATPR